MKIILLYAIIMLSLVSCTAGSNQSDNNQEATDSVNIESAYVTVETPGWLPFDTYSRNRNGHIYTKIQAEHGEWFVVWVCYTWKDSLNIPEESRNIASMYDCYGIDKNFLKIGVLASHDYLKSGKAINNREYDIPQWGYIIPDSEGEAIVNAAISVLEERYRYNRVANQLYSRSLQNLDE